MALPFGEEVTELDGTEYIQLWKPSTLLNGMMDNYRGNLLDLLAAGESTFAGITVTGALDIDETSKDSIFNPLKGSTADVIIHGDTIDNIFLADVSGDEMFIEGALTINNSKGVEADLLVHGDTVDSILFANVSADTVSFAGITIINPLSGDFADFEINGDTIADIFLADVSADTIFMDGSIIINEAGGAVSLLRVEGDTDAALLVTDPVNDRVGIGVAAPVTKLHASGSTILGCASAAAADGDLGISQINLAVDEVAHNLLIKIKYSDTTVKTATVALT